MKEKSLLAADMVVEPVPPKELSLPTGAKEVASAA